MRQLIQMGWMTVSLQKVEQDTLFEIILAANYLDIKVAYIIQEPEHHSPSISKSLREGVQKNRFFWTLSQTMGRWGSKVTNFLVKITIQSSLLQTRFF